LNSYGKRQYPELVSKYEAEGVCDPKVSGLSMLAITGNEKQHGHPVLLSGILRVIGLIAMLMIVREGL